MKSKILHTFCNRKQVRRTVSAIILLCLFGICHVRDGVCALPTGTLAGDTPTELKPIAQLDLYKTFPKGSMQPIGFIDKDTFILSNIEERLKNIGQIIRWDIPTKKSDQVLPLSKLIYGNSLQISQNGKFLITRETPLFANHARTHKVTVIHTTDFRVIKTIDFDTDIHVTEFFFLSGDDQHAVVTLASRIPLGSDFIDGNDKFAWLNIDTGKVDKTLSYIHARGARQILLSPSQNYFACLFTNEDIPNDSLGILDVLDPNTGKILWHLEGNEKQPIGDPFFFISPTKFVSSSAIYDITTKTHSPLIPANDSRLYCITNVTGKTDYAFFMTKAGLELWNMKTNQVLRRWPALTGQGFILISPDLKMFSYQLGENIQFWKFDPAWLK